MVFIQKTSFSTKFQRNSLQCIFLHCLNQRLVSFVEDNAEKLHFWQTQHNLTVLSSYQNFL